MDIYSNMVQFLANPLVSFIGYAIGVISGAIGIIQTLASKRKDKEIIKLNENNSFLVVENNQLKMVINQNKISQGEKSQYFQSNSGPVNIDVR